MMNKHLFHIRNNNIYVKKNKIIYTYYYIERRNDISMANISLADAKAMISEESVSKLKEIVTPKVMLNMDTKVNNDIIMSALCTAVSNGVIKMTSLDDRLIKLLNSPTNTLSSTKLGSILTHIRETQPKMCCVITLKSGDMTEVIQEWTFTGPTVYFNKIFEFVVQEFNITPSIVRNKMTEMLKATIVNNVAQLVAKYASLETEEEKKAITISISTITRLVNMSGYLLMAEFKDVI